MHRSVPGGASHTPSVISHLMKDTTLSVFGSGGDVKRPSVGVRLKTSPSS